MLKIRLRRMGSRHRPFYRIVVSDSRRTPLASALEEIGHYDPRKDPVALSLDVARAEHWMSVGAKPSETVEKLIEKARTAGSEAPATEAEAEEKAEATEETKAEAAEETKAEAAEETKAEAAEEKEAEAEAEDDSAETGEKAAEAAEEKAEDAADAASEDGEESTEAAADEVSK